MHLVVHNSFHILLYEAVLARLVFTESVKARKYDAISCTQLLSNSMIRKSSVCFEHDSTKESYDTNRIVLIGLNIANKYSIYQSCIMIFISLSRMLIIQRHNCNF